jgi:hypothetical protein
MFNPLLLLFIFMMLLIELDTIFIGLFSRLNNLYEASVNKVFYSQSVQSLNP